MKRKISIQGKALILTLALSATTSAIADNAEQRTQAAMEVAQSFMIQLGKTMKSAMQKDGPVAAINVCAEQAPKMTADISRSQGWKVTRVSTRVRNPMLGMPDVWEQKVLAQFQARLDRGESLKTMSFSEMVTEPNGRYFRFAKAIGVKPQCLTCHGSKNDIPSAVKQKLQQQYPFDKATDYRAGDLRGAVSIKQPLPSM
ncbi:MAG: DUF3365 domain-containing protein [Gammaproteobacteria bacterium]|nr:DUF3365 domain-containing protein [Gammaproteobacteria bacterium]